jgi:pyridoxal phosphate-dependent aminotransferase EpsN
MKNRIYLSPPFMSGLEKTSLIKAYESNWIAPTGPQVDMFENEIKDYVGVNNACALSSGTAALHLSLKILGIKSGDYVLCPSLTFAATANSILYVDAEPVFIDVDPQTWTLDINILENAIKKYKPKAIITVDLYGQSCDYDNITELCSKYNVIIIEDSAEALGSKYKKTRCGGFGSMSILSFNGNKIITTSGGGMILSQNEKYTKKAKFLASQAREPELHYEHKQLGYNYRLSNLLAAVGLGQLVHLNSFIKKRRKIFDNYEKSLSQFEGVSFMKEPSYSHSNRWLTTLTFDKKKCRITPNKIINYLQKENIESRPVWKPMHLQPLFKGCKYLTIDDKDFSKDLFLNGLCLPSGVSLVKKDQNRIIDIISSLLN